MESDGVPTEEDLQAAVNALSSPTALCFAQLAFNNENRVAAELCFNSIIVDRSGRMEIALRTAILDLTSTHYTRSWRWNQTIAELADGLTYSVSSEETAAEAASINRTEQNGFKPEIQGKIKVPAFELDATLAPRATSATPAAPTSTPL